MAKSGIVVNEIQGVTVVTFQHASILEASVMDQIAAELYPLVDEQARRKIVLDFAAVRFLASQVIGVLIALNKKSQAIKGQVVLCGLQENLSKVFKITKLDKVFSFARDEKEALGLLGVGEPA